MSRLALNPFVCGGVLEDCAHDRLPIGSIDPVTGSVQVSSIAPGDLLGERRA
jgi:hypothetical protein